MRIETRLGLAAVLLAGATACGEDAAGESPAAGGAAAGGNGSAGSGGSALGGSANAGAAAAAPSGVWSMGYYASWQAAQYPVAEIEWSGLTHIAIAFYLPNADGTLDLLGGNPQLASELVAAAHANSVQAVASIGGADSSEAFRQATSTDTMSAFIDNLVALLQADGYDGIDIDWEPLEAADEPTVVELADQIRRAQPDALLTIPIGCINPNLDYDLSGYSAIAAAYDQLNLMSYGLSGAWPGWNSWHSSALYHTNSATPLSIDSSVQLYVAAGVPVAKLGLGIGFYGLCYSPPVTGPDQPLDGATVLAGDSTMSYRNIMTRYYEASARQWDSLARVPYLSYDSPRDPDGCTYISYDDEQSIEEKGAYLRSQGLGGVIQWEINEGHLPAASAGERSPLLLAIRTHILQ